MIDLFSGTPGSGKSLHAAKVILDELYFGHDVIGNFPVELTPKQTRRAKYHYVELDALTPGYLIAFSQDYFQHRKKREDALTVIIDEAQLLFNCREWSKQGRAEWLSFFTQHRKYGYHVILVAQFDAMLDRQIRSLIEYEYIHRKVSNFGWRGKIISWGVGGGLFVAVQVWYPMRTKVGSEFFKFRKRLGAIYDTNAVFAVPTNNGKN